VSDTLALVSHLMIEPLRICLIATVLAYCLEHATRHPAEDVAPALPTTPAGSESIRPPT